MAHKQKMTHTMIQQLKIESDEHGKSEMAQKIRIRLISQHFSFVSWIKSPLIYILMEKMC